MTTRKKPQQEKRKRKSRWAKQQVKAHKNTGEIITKPNQSSSIRDILFRNTQGMSYDNYKTPYYEDQATFSSQSLNKIQEMEPTEKLQYLKELNGQIDSLKKKIEEDEKARQAVAVEQAQVVEQPSEPSE